MLIYSASRQLAVLHMYCTLLKYFLFNSKNKIIFYLEGLLLVI